MEKIKSYFTREGWKKDWEKTKSHVQTFGKFLYDILDGGSTARSNEWKQGILDLMARIESPEYQAQFAGVHEAVNRRAREQHFLALGRPDLAYPDIYATSPAQPLETKFNDVKSLYR